MHPTDYLDFIYADNLAESERLKAWIAHYAAKGCGEWRARAVGRKRWERKGGWPRGGF